MTDYRNTHIVLFNDDETSKAAYPVGMGRIMEAILLIGIPASGKSTFYKENFFNTHIRISNDLLKTKNREKLLIEYCNKTQISLVIDNTSITKEIRLHYITALKQMNYTVKGYYFKALIKRSLEWNKKRTGKDVIPDVGIIDFYKRLEIPTPEEGFDALYSVEIINGQFVVKDWHSR